MRSAVGIVLVGFLAAASAACADAAADETMNQEIDYLLETVADSGCTFVRNGKEHDAAAARDHLALKRRRGKKYFTSAEEFIDRLASSSSWTGKPYSIHCGAEESPAKDWFTERLQEYRERPARVVPSSGS